jgi:hypothetical protein
LPKEGLDAGPVGRCGIIESRLLSHSATSAIAVTSAMCGLLIISGVLSTGILGLIGFVFAEESAKTFL